MEWREFDSISSGPCVSGSQEIRSNDHNLTLNKEFLPLKIQFNSLRKKDKKTFEVNNWNIIQKLPP